MITYKAVALEENPCARFVKLGNFTTYVEPTKEIKQEAADSIPMSNLAYPAILLLCIGFVIIRLVRDGSFLTYAALLVMLADWLLLWSCYIRNKVIRTGNFKVVYCRPYFIDGNYVYVCDPLYEEYAVQSVPKTFVMTTMSELCLVQISPMEYWLLRS